jgi:hypothetical protein
MLGQGMLLSKPMENWMIPIAMALSFGSVQRMMINIPPTSDVEWMKTVSAKMATKILSFVSQLPSSQIPFLACRIGSSGGNRS